MITDIHVLQLPYSLTLFFRVVINVFRPGNSNEKSELTAEFEGPSREYMCR